MACVTSACDSDRTACRRSYSCRLIVCDGSNCSARAKSSCANLNVALLLSRPFSAQGAAFAYAGRLIEPGQQDGRGSWTGALAEAPTVWESFRLVAG